MGDYIIDLDKISALPESVLHHVYKTIGHEINIRKIESNDLNLLINEGFATGFNNKGLPKEPKLINGLLLASGAKIDKGKMTHLCGFVKINDKWVWESANKVVDDVRFTTGRYNSMQTITIATLNHLDKVDMIECVYRNGVHRMKTINSYIMEDNILEKVSSRVVSIDSHR